MRAKIDRNILATFTRHSTAIFRCCILQTETATAGAAVGLSKCG